MTSKMVVGLAMPVIAWTCLLSNIKPVHAADVSSVLDPNASLVLVVNVKQLSVPRLLRALTPIAGKEAIGQLLPVQMASTAIVSSLQKSGVEQVIVSLALQDIARNTPAIIIPTEHPDEVEEVVKQLLEMVPIKIDLEVHRQDGLLVLAHPATWKRMTDPSLKQPSGLQQHFGEHNNELMALTIGFNEDVRRSVTAVWPDQLPPESPVALSPQRWMRDVDAITLTLKLGDQLNCDAWIHCTSDQAAQGIDAELKPLLNLAGQVQAKTLHYASSVDKLATGFQPMQKSIQSSATDMQVQNNMKQIAIAANNFHQAYQGFPPRMTVDQNSRTLLSWRVFLLPYLAEQALYDQFHLDEPWDSPHNKTLIDKMPKVYADPRVENAMGKTRLQVVLGPGSPWSGNEDRLIQMKDLTDGTSNTICFAEVPSDQAVIWTKPSDFELADVAAVAQRLYGTSDSILVAMFDTSIQTLTRDQAQTIPALLTSQGREPAK